MSWKSGLAAAAVVLVLGCTGNGDPGGDPVTDRGAAFLPEPSPALSESLLAGLAQAKNLHHMAALYLADGDPDRALATLARILEIDMPAGAPEAEDIRLDARARMAKVAMMQGDLDGALDMVETGIAKASRPSFFVANLYTVKGEIYQARAVALDATDPDGSRAARKMAIAAYERSNQINVALQKSLMKNHPPAKARP
ncbi:MAG TPA: hypothetical protein VFG83_03050 [Kofleriaceae bacterium]|nr:hypothetical protein [Kofleriaceae bacterium]